MENIQYKGYTINIKYDEICESPRVWDNLGNMLCFHNSYDLGDSNIKDEFCYNKECKLKNLTDYCKNWDEVGEVLKKEFNAVVIMPLWLYDHSNISMKTCRHGQHSGWDCGQVGFIYVTRENILKEYGVKRITKKLIEKVENILINEVEIYSDYISGNCYGYNIENEEGDFIDSCCGFYGYDFENNGLLEYAKNAIDCDIEKIREEKQKKLKSFIKNRVELAYRV